MNFRKLRKYRRIFYLIGIIILIVVFISIRRKYNNTICANIKVVVLDSNNAKFISKSSIIRYLGKNYKKDIIGNTFNNIKLSDIETNLTNNPFVKRAEVFRNKDNDVEIHVHQIHPILRVFDIKNNSYYIDKGGYFIPTSPNFASYVTIFSGNIPVLNKNIISQNMNIEDTIVKNKIFKNCYLLAKELKKNSFTDQLIDQVFVNNQNEFELVPKIGNFRIILGNLDNLEDKIRNLEAFYKKAAPKVRWNKYSKINLKYTNQIVCTFKK